MQRILKFLCLTACCLEFPHPGISCTVTATNIHFGTYDPTATTPKKGTGIISISCPNGTIIDYKIGLFSTKGRKMIRQGGSDKLEYELYKEGTYTDKWGTLGQNAVEETNQNCSTACTHTVYGQILKLQNVPPGSYTDTVSVMVNYN